MSELLVNLAGPATLLATYLLHSTLAVGLVWLVVRFARVKSHSLTEQLWKGAALAGLITAPVLVYSGWALPGFDLTVAQHSPEAALAEPPASFEIQRDETGVTEDVFVETATPTKETQPARDSTPDADSIQPVPENALPATAADDARDLPRGSRQELAAVATAESVPADWRKRTVMGISAAAMLAALLALVRLVVQSASFGNVFRSMSPCEAGAARDALNDVLARASIGRRIQLYSTSQLDEPAAFGLLQWSIVVPAGLEQRLPREQLTALLAHEVAHLVRGDVLWLWFGRVLCTLLAIQPLNRFARRQWRAAAEYQCDDWAVGQNIAPLALARCLTSVAEWRQRAIQPALLAAGGDKKHLSRRVERLVAADLPDDPWRKPLRRLLVGAATLTGLAVMSVCGPRLTIAAPEVALAENDAPVANPTATTTLPTRPFDVEQPTAKDDARPGDDAGADVVVDAPPADVATRALIRDEMAQLESEIDGLSHEIDAYLSQTNPTDETRPIVEQLRRRFEILRRHRDALKNLQKQF